MRIKLAIFILFFCSVEEFFSKIAIIRYTLPNPQTLKIDNYIPILQPRFLKQEISNLSDTVESLQKLNNQKAYNRITNYIGVDESFENHQFSDEYTFSAAICHIKIVNDSNACIETGSKVKK